jgi:hypothetical protein
MPFYNAGWFGRRYAQQATLEITKQSFNYQTNKTIKAPNDGYWGLPQ